MAKKTRTELSTLAVNTNLPDNTSEQITPTTERAQLTEERASVINYKDDLGGTGNAGKFLTVAADGESLTMVDGATGNVTGSGAQYQVAVWDGASVLTGNVAFQFLTGAQNSIKLTRGTGSGNILFYASDGTTLHGYIENQVSGNGLTIGQQDGSTSAVIDLDDSTITFKIDNNTALTIDSGRDANFFRNIYSQSTLLTSDGSTANYRWQTYNNASDDAYRINSRNKGDVLEIGYTTGRILIGTNVDANRGILTLGGATGIYYEGNSNGKWQTYVGSGGDLVFYNWVGGGNGSISTSGNFTNSDISLKNDIKNIKYGLLDVLKLKPSSYVWKSNNENGFGFIAQEIEEIIPEVVKDVDIKGKNQKVVNYANITAILTKAIQEQQTIIEDLKARIEKLEL